MPCSRSTLPIPAPCKYSRLDRYEGRMARTGWLDNEWLRVDNAPVRRALCSGAVTRAVLESHTYFDAMSRAGHITSWYAVVFANRGLRQCVTLTAQLRSP